MEVYWILFVALFHVVGAGLVVFPGGVLAPSSSPRPLRLLFLLFFLKVLDFVLTRMSGRSHHGDSVDLVGLGLVHVVVVKAHMDFSRVLVVSRFDHPFLSGCGWWSLRLWLLWQRFFCTVYAILSFRPLGWIETFLDSIFWTAIYFELLNPRLADSRAEGSVKALGLSPIFN